MFTLRNEKGLVLPVVLIVLAVVTAMGGAAVVLTKTDLKVGGNYRSNKRAFYIAEAGVNRAWTELVDGDGTNDFSDVFSDPPADPPRDLFIDELLGDGVYDVNAKGVLGSDPNLVKVTSEACLPAGCAPGSAKSTIEAVFRARETVFQFAILAKRKIILSGGAITDSFDSRVADYNVATAGSEGHVGTNLDILISGNASTTINGNATASDDIVLSGNSRITGDATAGDMITTGGLATIAGTETPNASPPPSYNFPPVNSPCGSSYHDGSGFTVTAGSYDLSNGDLTTLGGSEITLESGIYCLKSIDLQGGSTLRVSGPVSIYITEHSEFSGGSFVNTTQIPSNLQLFSTHVSNNSGLEISGSGTAYMTIYAPDAQIEFSGKSDIMGAVVAGRIDNNGGSRIHYDKALEDPTNTGIELVSWKEVF